VHRNIGNLVPGNDLNALSVLEYAVGHLHINDIIVVGEVLKISFSFELIDRLCVIYNFTLGHYDCGAIRAATSRQDLGTLENWLRQIRDVYRLHKDYLDLLKVRRV
jgi:carbonic anhydrase